MTECWRWCPAKKLEEAANWFGDSERRVAQIDAFTVGLGMALGVLVGLIEVPLPGGITLKLGVAAGPLVVGMVLGWVGRTALHLGMAATRQLNHSPAGFAAVLGGNWAGFRPGLCGRSFLSHRREGGGTGGPDCCYQWRRGVGWWASVWL